jgi:hypothetical protein
MIEPTRTIEVEGYAINVPTSVKPENERAHMLPTFCILFLENH